MATAIFRKWNGAQNAYLRRSWEKVPMDEMMTALGRTQKAIEDQAYRLLGTTIDRAPAQGRTKGRRISTRLKETADDRGGAGE